MKKVALALILCLVLTVFAFASCGKGEKTDTTADPTSPATPAATDPAPGTTTAHVHIPADDYSIDEKPTCAWPGSQSRHCTVCDDAKSAPCLTTAAKKSTTPCRQPPPL